MLTTAGGEERFAESAKWIETPIAAMASTASTAETAIHGALFFAGAAVGVA
jgi:uncharacterized membrane protein